jgi:GntR family transcriptional regulator, transcriptional repressor for pyruvate dehydrogenase complex
LVEQAKSTGKTQRRQLVKATAARLRDIILEREPGTNIGSLKEVAQMLDVGIVTVQQAARILEHEGLLEVRRGPGGGYHGRRPDEAALERALEAYWRVHGLGVRESQEMLALLDCEIMPAAARCEDETLMAMMRALHERVESCDTPEQRVEFEMELRQLLFRMVARPLIELLSRVTSRVHVQRRLPLLFRGEEGVAAWKAGRGRILQAILQRDQELARFEAERYRKTILERLRAWEATREASERG